MKNAKVMLCYAVLVAVLMTATAACEIRKGQFGAVAPVLGHHSLRPAPEWVAEHLAQAVPDVYFDLNGDIPRDAEHDALSRSVPALNAILRDFPDLVIVIEGHCDNRGSSDYNLQLGKRRATAVRQILVDAGFPSLHLWTMSIGDTRPQCHTKDEACRQKNRRVHLKAAKVPGEER